MEQQNQQPKSKDVMVLCKGVEMRKNKKGGDYITLKLNPAETAALANELATQVTERGSRVDIHISEKETEDGSRTFLSAIAFVKGIQDPPVGGFARSNFGSSKPAVSSVTAQTSSALAALRTKKEIK